MVDVYPAPEVEAGARTRAQPARGELRPMIARGDGRHRLADVVDPSFYEERQPSAAISDRVLAEALAVVLDSEDPKKLHAFLQLCRL